MYKMSLNKTKINLHVLIHFKHVLKDYNHTDK